MTHTKDEALDLALEALEANQPVNYCVNSKGEKFPMFTKDPFKFERNAKAISAIKQARSAPVQEPVAWTDKQLQMLNFLYGSGEWDGLWFDQKHPTKQGAFWWRADLRKLFATPPTALVQEK